MSNDHDEITRLKYRYFRMLDLKRWEEFAGCFVPEATGDYAGLVFDDRDSLVAFMAENMGPQMISMHHAHHPEIAVDGDTATGIWYLEDKVIIPELKFVLEGAAFYDDRYVRTPEGWRIAHTGYRRTYEASWSTEDVPSLKIKRGTAYDEQDG
ncbi:nuclear transport factor 2 family protein [Nocardioides terrisoli]|uniref:nuclear transport factor 2 family protein n=1 Tax=Nocardioides terrisoli TaxID=3388267 RepID=UPI00287B6834|nr:nuclear transport factor 2 family protein [Nocardioides marmorisolisilvae]